LAAGGARVARAIESQKGKLVEVVDDGVGGQFLATAFVKAPGKPPGKANWNPELFKTYGGLIGQMHQLTKQFQPLNANRIRPHWNDPEMLEIQRFLPAEEEKVRIRYLELMDYLQTLPQDKNSYGLIHQDAHGGNFFVDETGQITLFDFDDCAYSWFANDIAIVLFYAVMGSDDANDFTELFLSHFFEGYRLKNTLDPVWLDEIPNFLKLREIDMYAIIHRSFDVENLNDPWCVAFMQNRRAKIEKNTPYIDFDFDSLRGCF